MERSGSTAWKGGLPEGKGSVSTESRTAIQIGAAHAACSKACAHSVHQCNWYILNRGDWRCRL
jgi:hypothetical protein